MAEEYRMTNSCCSCENSRFENVSLYKYANKCCALSAMLNLYLYRCASCVSYLAINGNSLLSAGVRMVHGFVWSIIHGHPDRTHRDHSHHT